MLELTVDVEPVLECGHFESALHPRRLTLRKGANVEAVIFRCSSGHLLSDVLLRGQVSVVRAV